MLLTTDAAKAHYDKSRERDRRQEAVVGRLKLFQEHETLSTNTSAPEPSNRVLRRIVMKFGASNSKHDGPRIAGDEFLEVASPTRGQAGQFELQCRHLPPRHHAGQGAVGHDRGQQCLVAITVPTKRGDTTFSFD